jgi:hypothetical protein
MCPVCCATEREESLDCPLDCEYLHAAHRHEQKPAFDPATFPNQDIEVTESFLAANEILIAFLAVAIYEGAIGSPGSTDWDIREALQSLIGKDETQTLGQHAEAIAKRLQSAIDELQRKEQEETGAATTISETTRRGVLAFLQRLEYSHNNGRKQCRAFIDFLSTFYTAPEPEPVV